MLVANERRRAKMRDTPCGTAPVVTMRQSAMSNLRARATIIFVLRAPRTPSVRPSEPLSEGAVFLKQKEAPRELDQAAAHPGIARFGETFLAPL